MGKNHKMCGIAGFLIKKTDIRNIKNYVPKLLESLRSRGPDSQGQWSDQHSKIFLLNTRLKIQDLTNKANMPMITGCKNYIITYNGEIYNKNFLIKNHLKNENLKTSSDTEVILLLYKKYKEACLSMLDGMFSIAIFDVKENELFLARDPMGIKPLYYLEDEDYFLFSSSIKSLMFYKNKINYSSIINYFALGYINDPNTILKDVYSLEPGKYLKITNKNIKVKKYFELTDILQSSHSEPDKYFIESIKKHFTKDVNSCLFLSSGTDSNIILSLLNNMMIKIPCVSINFETKDKKYINEEININKISKIHNIELITKKFCEEEVVFLRDKFIKNMDQPSTDGFNIFLASKIAKENNFKVAYSGLGGDELFCDYGNYQKITLIKKINNICETIGIKEFVRFFLKKIQFNNPKYSHVLDTNDINELYFLVRSLFYKNEKINFLQHNLALEDFFSKIGKFKENDTAFKRISCNEYKIYMQNQLLRDGDWTSMYHSIELRLPFVNAELIKNCFQGSYKKNIRKEILKRSNINVYNLLKNINKIGFYTPYYAKTKYHNTLKDLSITTMEQFININHLKF